MNTTNATTMTANAPIASSATMLMSPCRAASNERPIAAGNPDTMLEKISSEMPLPTPRSVICSPSHIMNSAPVTSVVTATKWNAKPVLNASPWFASVAASAEPWISETSSVP